MPKEQINHPYAVPVSDAETGMVLMRPPGPEFSVHWSNDAGGYVQIGVEFDLAQIEEYTRQLRKDSPTDAIGYLYSDPLTRHEVQVGIRSLKRARNAVFGADE